MYGKVHLHRASYSKSLVGTTSYIVNARRFESPPPSPLVLPPCPVWPSAPSRDSALAPQLLALGPRPACLWAVPRTDRAGAAQKVDKSQNVSTTKRNNALSDPVDQRLRLLPVAVLPCSPASFGAPLSPSPSPSPPSPTPAPAPRSTSPRTPTPPVLSPPVSVRSFVRSTPPLPLPTLPPPPPSPPALPLTLTPVCPPTAVQTGAAVAVNEEEDDADDDNADDHGDHDGCRGQTAMRGAGYTCWV